MLDPYELQVFLTAAETESFSATARRLHLTQPAVSKQIQTLEQRLMRPMYTSAASSEFVSRADVGSRFFGGLPTPPSRRPSH